MANVEKRLIFADTGNPKREKENFQNYIFDSVNTGNHSIPISFYRSDFRGAKFLNSFFYKNNFSNSDYIDSYVNNTVYRECIFKVAEVYNSFFENTAFENTLFSSTSFIRSNFINSSFIGIKFTSSNFQDSKFDNCKIEKCSFFKTSVDEVDFIKTTFTNVDLSPMTAINLYFSDCTFENVTIDADYLGSYFFKGLFLDQLKLKYRGKVVNIKLDKIDLLANLFKILMEKERFYEAINIIVQKNFLTGVSSSIFPIIHFALNRLELQSNPLIRGYQIKKIFRLMEYYFNTGYIKLPDYFKTIGFVDNLSILDWGIEEQIEIVSYCARLKNLIYLSPIESSMLSTDFLDQILLTITIDEDDEEDFEELLERVLTNTLNINKAKGELYFILKKRKGSLIYDIVIYTSIGLLLINSFKKYLVRNKKDNRVAGLRSEIAEAALTKMIGKINEANKPKEIREILEVAQLASTLNQDSFLSDSNASQLLSIIKGMQGQSTALKD